MKKNFKMLLLSAIFSLALVHSVFAATKDPVFQVEIIKGGFSYNFANINGTEGAVYFEEEIEDDNYKTKYQKSYKAGEDYPDIYVGRYEGLANGLPLASYSELSAVGNVYKKGNDFAVSISEKTNIMPEYAFYNNWSKVGDEYRYDQNYIFYDGNDVVRMCISHKTDEVAFEGTDYGIYLPKGYILTTDNTYLYDKSFNIDSINVEVKDDKYDLDQHLTDFVRNYFPEESGYIGLITFDDNIQDIGYAKNYVDDINTSYKNMLMTQIDDKIVETKFYGTENDFNKCAYMIYESIHKLVDGNEEERQKAREKAKEKGIVKVATSNEALITITKGKIINAADVNVATDSVVTTPDEIIIEPVANVSTESVVLVNETVESEQENIIADVTVATINEIIVESQVVEETETLIEENIATANEVVETVQEEKKSQIEMLYDEMKNKTNMEDVEISESEKKDGLKYSMKTNDNKVFAYIYDLENNNNLSVEDFAKEESKKCDIKEYTVANDKAFIADFVMDGATPYYKKVTFIKDDAHIIKVVEYVEPEEKKIGDDLYIWLNLGAENFASKTNIYTNNSDELLKKENLRVAFDKNNENNNTNVYATCYEKSIPTKYVKNVLMDEITFNAMKADGFNLQEQLSILMSARNNTDKSTEIRERNGIKYAYCNTKYDNKYLTDVIIENATTFTNVVIETFVNDNINYKEAIIKSIHRK